jgi:hypothetical protein
MFGAASSTSASMAAVASRKMSGYSAQSGLSFLSALRRRAVAAAVEDEAPLGASRAWVDAIDQRVEWKS